MYVPLKCKTHYSILESLIKPEKLAAKLAEQGLSACAMVDSQNISGAVEFSECLRKKNIKPIIGIEFLIQGQYNGTLVCLAKNKNGWQELVKLVGLSNRHDKILNDRPSLVLDDFTNISNLICLTGHSNTILANACIKDKIAYTSDSESLYNPDAIEDGSYLVNLLKDIFGKDNVFLEAQLLKNLYQDLFKDKFIIEDFFTGVVRKIGKSTGTKVVASVDPHYLLPQDEYDHRLILSSYYKTVFGDLHATAEKHGDYQLQQFTHNSNFLLNNDDVESLYPLEEIENTKLVADMCEDYSLTSQPRTPKFPCPDGLSEIEYLRQLARKGYKDKFNNGWNPQVYGDRAKLELEVIERVGLAGYFLIVQDYVNWAKERMLVGCARGSAAGCLISYLTGITGVDPIPYHLLFERFYNEGRNTPGKVSYPDIDIDFPVERRGEVIEYIRNKYGADKVAHIVTFGRMQGRGALKEVFRVHNVCDMETMNTITKSLPQEHEIADKLEEEKQESIIMWVLDNEPDLIGDWCRLTDGVMTGDYASYFAQAARLEGVFRSRGKHASGIVISADNLYETCPMIYDKSSDAEMVGMEMESAEKMGLLKLDILGLNSLDKTSMALDLLKG